MSENGNRPGKGAAYSVGEASKTATESTHHPTTTQAALDYAARGYAVFPCLPGSKHPALPGGFKNGTCNPATIRRWWLADPDYNVGIATGVTSGVWILDVDGRDGATSLGRLE